MNKIKKKKQKIIFKSLRLKSLKKKQILSICKLKNTYWKWTIKNQLEWFNKTVKKTDINNMLIINNRLVGYTLLRKRKAYYNKRYLVYYYFDSFLIDKKYRNKGLGTELMLFNNKTLKKLRKHSFLICPTNTSNFYIKNNWNFLPKNKFKIMDHKSFWFKNKSNIKGMIFNFKKEIKSRIYYYIN